jgi:cell division protein FtsZ
MMFELDHQEKTVARLKVIGVGGAGGNAVNRMIESGLQGVEFIALNTDAMALQNNQAEFKIQIGSKLTKGLGAGANPQTGMLSMEEDLERLREQLEGTGAAPVVAELARSMGILTVAVVTRPFQWEGSRRDANAQTGIEAMRRVADTVIVVPNQKLLSVVEKNTPMKQAFKMADEVLNSATRGISEIILRHGEVNADFADVRAVMAQGGDAILGTGRASGENKARIAVDRAIHSPLLDNVSIAGATAVLVNVIGGPDMTMYEVDEAMNYLHEELGKETNANIINGFVCDENMGDEIAVTVIATGFGGTSAAKARQSHEPFRRTPAYPQPEITRPAQILASLAPLTPMAPTASSSASETNEGATSELSDKSFLPQVPESRSRIEEGPIAQPGKVPFGVRPSSRPAFVPAPRPNEERPALQEAGTAASRQNSLFSGLFGNPKTDAEPDIDYETPAFLRNQAD